MLFIILTAGLFGFFSWVQLLIEPTYSFMQGSLDAFNAERAERERQKEEAQARDRAKVAAMFTSRLCPLLKDRKEPVQALVPHLTAPAW